MRLLPILLCLGLLCACSEPPPPAQTLRIAVAANFAPTLKELIAAYSVNQPIKLQPMIGSTGMLATQIEAGAPFDMFFAADTARPERLVEAGKTLGVAHPYAIGQLALWMPMPDYKSVRKRLLEGDYERMVIANPSLAPYGAAAQAVLERQGLWDSVRGSVVQAENIGQAYHYVTSGRVDLGFVALSQIIKQGRDFPEEALWVVPKKMHGSLEQSVVILKGKNEALASNFLGFCLGDEGRAIIQAAGYRLPEKY